MEKLISEEKKIILKAKAFHIGHHTKITYNKDYEIIEFIDNDTKIVIIDDTGNRNQFYKSRFIINHLTE